MPISLQFKTKELVDKGWSGDKKYRVTDQNGCVYLLRVSPAAQYERKKSEFERMRQVASFHIPMCRPLQFGMCDEGVYSLQTWIDGQDAEACLPQMSNAQKYAYGEEAGRILQRMHALPIPLPKDWPEWEARFNRKIDYKLKLYNACTLKYEKDQPFLEYLASNRHLLKNRPQTYQHGDYHVGNMMIDHSGQLQIIDFNRDDFGDPWEEFNRIVWCAQSTPLFATGMVNGYFDNKVPMDFWCLLALYIACNTISSLPWAVPFGEGEINTMRKQAKEVLAWYDDMQNPVPTWYKGVCTSECF